MVYVFGLFLIVIKYDVSIKLICLFVCYRVVIMFVIMRKRDVCIQFSSMDVNSIPNLRPVGVLSLSKNLLQSEKALQTVDTEFNTGNAFGKYCQQPQNGKDKCEQGGSFVDILYSVTVESGTMHICRLTKMMTRLGRAIFEIFAISADKTTNKIEIFHFGYLLLLNFLFFSSHISLFLLFSILGKLFL